MKTITNTNFCGPMPQTTNVGILNLVSEPSAETTIGSCNSNDLCASSVEGVEGAPSKKHFDVSMNFSDSQNQPYLSKLLATVKLAGAVTIAAAMALFLYEGIEITNDLQRFYCILGFGGLLTALGLAVNKWLSDQVASRLFIGLSLGSVPVISTVLGGFTFSLTSAANLLSLPQYATWKLTSAASLYTALPLALLVMAAIAALGFKVMARSEARWLTAAFFVSNVLLLIPSRDGVVIALVASAAISFLVWVVRKHQVNPISFKTVEGLWALAILFLAPLIMIVRSAVFYQHEIIPTLIISTTMYAVSRHLFHRCGSGKKRETFALIATFFIRYGSGCLSYDFCRKHLLVTPGILQK